jgi:hypothetical protein
MRSTQLSKLTADLRSRFTAGELTAKSIADATVTLAQLKYSYNAKKFPTLCQTPPPPALVGTPQTLAEALLWKLGKWPAYRSFAAFYNAESTSPRPTHSVFDAFALHLKDQERFPIFDQHSLRAVWGICDLSTSEHEFCKSFLVEDSGRWKAAGSGKAGPECYRLFKTYLNAIRRQDPSLTLPGIDRLLMPLGQALKKVTRNYAAFCKLCHYQ